MIKITEEMQQRVDKAFEEKKYCVWATTSDDGFPDMSFRGSTFVFDDEHIAFWDRSFGAEHDQSGKESARLHALL